MAGDVIAAAEAAWGTAIAEYTGFFTSIPWLVSILGTGERGMGKEMELVA